MDIISSEYMLLNGYMSFLVASSFTFKTLHVLHNYSISLCRWLFPVNEGVHLQEKKPSMPCKIFLGKLSENDT